MAAPDTYVSASTITAGNPVPPGDGVAIACEVSGYVMLQMQDGSTLPVWAAANTTIVIDRVAVRDVVAQGTTATARVTTLRKA